MTDNQPTATEPAHSAFLVLAALDELGEATAATIAARCGLGYSTTTPKLRTWEHTGQAERFRNDNNQTMWRLTAAGRAAASSRTGTGPPLPTPAPDTPAGAAPDGHSADSDAADPHAAPDSKQATDTNPNPGTATGAAPQETETNPQAEADIAPAAAPVTAEPADQAPPAGHEATASDDDGTSAEASAPLQRRASGSLRDAVLAVLQDHRGQGLKVAQLCKLIDESNKDTDANKASAGAVSNAAHKLVATGRALLVAEQPATFVAVAVAEDS